MRRKWHLFLRWAFRKCGGYHLSEHKEIVWAAEVMAEKETAELRLNKVIMDQRHKMQSCMLSEELSHK